MNREERSAGFIPFHVAKDPPPRTSPSVPASSRSIRYLLLNHGRHWSFPKGHVEPGETDLAAAIRELREETGNSHPQVLPHFHREIDYFFRHDARGLIHKTVTYFLARVARRKVVLSSEHVGAEFLFYERALKQVTFASDREVLRLAHAHLKFADLHQTAT